MNEDFDSVFDEEELSLVNQFEEMQTNRSNYFFDVEELEVIIDYYLEKDFLLKAQQVINFALRLYPDSSVFLIKKAQLFSILDHPEKAFSILLQVEKNEPFNPEVYITRASLYSLKEQHQKAIDNLKKAVELSEHADDLDELYLNIAFEYENLNNYNDAIKYLKKAHMFNNKNKYVLFEMAYCYESCNLPEESIKCLKKIIDIDPYSKTAWFNLGVAYSTVNLFEKAIEAYDYAIAIDHTFSSAYFNKANALASLELFNDAIETYREVLHFETPDALTYFYIGECYEKNKNFETAIENYKKATEINPNLSDAWLGIGVCLDHCDKNLDALTYIRKAIEIESANAEYWYVQGVIQHKCRLYDDAIFSYKKVIELDVKNKDIWLDYSGIYNELGEYEQAKKILTQGIEFQPHKVELYYRMTVYLLNSGQLKEANLFLEKALQLDFDLHPVLFDYQPELKNNMNILDLIELYRP